MSSRVNIFGKPVGFFSHECTKMILTLFGEIELMLSYATTQWPENDLNLWVKGREWSWSAFAHRFRPFHLHPIPETIIFESCAVNLTLDDFIELDNIALWLNKRHTHVVILTQEAYPFYILKSELVPFSRKLFLTEESKWHDTFLNLLARHRRLTLLKILQEYFLAKIVFFHWRHRTYCPEGIIAQNLFERYKLKYSSH